MSKRLRILELSPQALVGLLWSMSYGKGKIKIIENELPQDVAVGATHYDPQRDVILLHIESDSFEPVDDCEPIPHHPKIKFAQLFTESLSPEETVALRKEWIERHQPDLSRAAIVED